jgi:hypothetical protein
MSEILKAGSKAGREFLLLFSAKEKKGLSCQEEKLHFPYLSTFF